MKKIRPCCAVLHDVAGWLHTLRLHKCMPSFEGMSWKDIVVMDEQALEAQSVAALSARKKCSRFSQWFA